MNTLSARTMRHLVATLDSAIADTRGASRLPGFLTSQLPEATGHMIFVRDALLEASLADVAVETAEAA